MADIAHMGATRIEILGDGNIPGDPTPTTAWIDSWHELLQTYGLMATNWFLGLDAAMWRERGLTAEEL